METITRGSRSRVGSMLVDKERQFSIEIGWMDDNASNACLCLRFIVLI